MNLNWPEAAVFIALFALVALIMLISSGVL